MLNSSDVTLSVFVQALPAGSKGSAQYLDCQQSNHARQCNGTMMYKLQFELYAIVSMQDEQTSAVQQSLQQAVSLAVSSRDEDLMALHQQLEESEAHLQEELEYAHAQLLDSQNIQHKLEQQLRDSEAKRYITVPGLWSAPTPAIPSSGLCTWDRQPLRGSEKKRHLVTQGPSLLLNIASICCLVKPYMPLAVSSHL